MGKASNSFRSWVGGDSVEPETKLFTAVLSQAVHDVFSSHVDKMDKDSAMNASYVRGKIRKKLLE